MSAQLAADLVLGHSMPAYCRHTLREGVRYMSHITPSGGTSEPLTLNVTMYNIQKALERGTCVHVHGELLHGTHGAAADLEVFDDAVTELTGGALEEGIIVAAGTVHNTYHFSIGDCLTIRFVSSNGQWFIAVPMFYFPPNTIDVIDNGDMVQVTGTFGGHLYRSDDDGRLIAIKPTVLAVPDRSLHFVRPAGQEAGGAKEPSPPEEQTRTEGIMKSLVGRIWAGAAKPEEPDRRVSEWLKGAEASVTHYQSGDEGHDGATGDGPLAR